MALPEVGQDDDRLGRWPGRGEDGGRGRTSSPSYSATRSTARATAATLRRRPGRGAGSAKRPSVSAPVPQTSRGLAGDEAGVEQAARRRRVAVADRRRTARRATSATSTTRARSAPESCTVAIPPPPAAPAAGRRRRARGCRSSRRGRAPGSPRRRRRAPPRRRRRRPGPPSGRPPWPARSAEPPTVRATTATSCLGRPGQGGPQRGRARGGSRAPGRPPGSAPERQGVVEVGGGGGDQLLPGRDGQGEPEVAAGPQQGREDRSRVGDEGHRPVGQRIGARCSRWPGGRW